jgi:hypothetical protein
MNNKTSSLIELVRADVDKVRAISVVKKHYSEIIQLNEEGIGLNKIHEKLCHMYADEIKNKRINLSLTNFYRILHKIEQQGCKKELEREIVTPKKTIEPKSTLNEWDNKSGVDHPFKK